VLYSLPKRRVPVYLSAFHEGAAELAGRLADGVWTLGDPRQAPKIVAPYREACEQSKREPGEIIHRVERPGGAHQAHRAAAEARRDDHRVLMNVSGGDPHAAIRVYGESVLPELR
jgi:alkanesulfonate monooxygenase SsuD/methylene tetrahydromethanopterin reductase-like flavin-dependent oxidoreductase (luciferase family)